MRLSKSVRANTCALLLTAGCLTAGTALAEQGVWDVEVDPTNGFGGLTETWGLSDAGTLYAEWLVFDGYPTDSTPDVGSFGPAPQSLTETTGAAFLTSGGNIYSFAATTDFDLTLTGDSAEPLSVRTVALRLGLIGTDIDPDSVLLNGSVPNIGDPVYTESVTGGFGGDEREWLFVWNNVADALEYQLDFTAAASSLSLEQLAVYAGPATVVPVPAAAWLFGSALGLLAWVRRRNVT